MTVQELVALLATRPADEEVVLSLEPDGFGFYIPIGAVGPAPVLPDREASSPRWYFSAQALDEEKSADRVTAIYPRDS